MMTQENPSRQGSSFRIWLVDLTHTGQTVAADCIPLGIGQIATYVESNLSLAHPVRVFKYPNSLKEAFETSEPPHIIGFSNYVWNVALAVEFARLVRRYNPQITIVCGGPNYPYSRKEQERFLAANPAIDFFVVKEGEQAFTRLVQELMASDNQVEPVKALCLPGIHALGRDGAVHFSSESPRLKDLGNNPSPYLSGKLDPFFDGVLQPLIQTNRGCPYGCTYCVEGTEFYNKLAFFPPEQVEAEIQYIGQKMADSRIKKGHGSRNDLFIADSNFGMFKYDLLTCQALASSRRHSSWPDYIHVATGKDKQKQVLEAAKLLEGSLRLSGSVQSLDPTVLKNIKRNNISTDSLMKLALEASQVGANSYSEIIMALPGDTFVAHMETIRQVIEAGFNFVLVWQLMLLPGTELASEDSKQRYGMVTRYRALPRCYGEYSLLGETSRVVEIEEICVAHRDFSYEDYLRSRRFHLFISIFYNDGIFSSITKLFKQHNLSIFRWMTLMAESPLPDGLVGLFERFLETTRSELWTSREDLEAFCAQPGVLERFLNGELGPNVLYLYKSLGLTHHISDLGTIVVPTARQCFQEAGLWNQELATFIDDAVLFHVLSASNIFWNYGETPTATMHFDIPGFLASDKPFQDFRLPSPKTYYFVMDKEKQGLVRTQISLYGDSPVGIARIITKVFLRKLFRTAQTNLPSD